MGFYEYIGSQCKRPTGVIGKICCIIMNIINRQMYQSVEKEIKLNSNSTMLDIGYGNGYLIRKIYDLSHSHIYGIDVSNDAKKDAAKRNRRGINAGRIHLEVGDCCKMRYKGNFFDVVTTVNTIYFWKDVSQGLAEIYRVVKDGGTFTNVFYSKEILQKMKYTKKGFRYFDGEEFVQLAKKAGFSKVTVKKISNERGYMVTCTK